MPDVPKRHNVDLAVRLEQVVKRVREAEQRFGRDPGSVQILPVSKTRPPRDISQIAQAGFTAFGENYLQEAQAKIAELTDLGLQWHFIGPIQSNKTQTIASLFNWVHSVDREKIARRLLQVNVSGEKSKSGVQPSALFELASCIVDLPRLCLRGLMVIPAPVTDFGQQRQTFKAVHEIFDALKMELGNPEGMMDTLSMGMSNDLEAAIAEGSTMVRIGTDQHNSLKNMP
jgi:pyridoxal phosphate enzyme (YggS family)